MAAAVDTTVMEVETVSGADASEIREADREWTSGTQVVPSPVVLGGGQLGIPNPNPKPVPQVAQVESNELFTSFLQLKKQW